MTDLRKLARELGRTLRLQGLMVATAESCTGGWLAQAITAVPGSSTWFDRGFVTYSNEAKQELLGVSRVRLERFGAVSEPVAKAMAEGALRHSQAELTAAITGIAGPDGGTPEKPVGTVCFAWARRGIATTTVTRRYAGGRAAVRRQAVAEALSGLIAAARQARPR